MTRFKLVPYPHYQECSHKWLGKVPAHWQILPHRTLFVERKERGVPKEELLSVSISKGITKQTDFLTNSSKKDSSNEDKSKYKLVIPSDIVFNKMRAWQGAIGVSQYRGIVSPAYIVHRLRENNDPWFFHYLFRTPYFAKEAERWSYGITSDQWSLRSEDFKCIYSCVPPLEEQQKIVNFIQHQDRRIRKFIRNKKRLIELLEEQKLCVIRQKLMGGYLLELQSSGNSSSLAGVLPDRWKISSLGYRYRVQLGKMLDAKKITGEHLVPYLRNTDVQWDLVRTSELPLMDIHPEEYQRYTVQVGDLLVCEGGDIGRCAFWDGSIAVCGYQKALHRLRPYQPNQENTRFLFFLMFLCSKLGIFRSGGDEATIAHLTAEKLRKYRLPFPPREQQDAIVSILERSCSDIEISIEGIQKEIRLMTEYRSRLIADAVTGKIDLRSFPIEQTEEPFEELSDIYSNDFDADPNSTSDDEELLEEVVHAN